MLLKFLSKLLFDTLPKNIFQMFFKYPEQLWLIEYVEI